jgi:hypothetical protein
MESDIYFADEDIQVKNSGLRNSLDDNELVSSEASVTNPNKDSLINDAGNLLRILSKISQTYENNCIL